METNSPSDGFFVCRGKGERWQVDLTNTTITIPQWLHHSMRDHTDTITPTTTSLRVNEHYQSLCWWWFPSSIGIGLCLVGVGWSISYQKRKYLSDSMLKPKIAFIQQVLQWQEVSFVLNKFIFIHKLLIFAVLFNLPLFLNYFVVYLFSVTLLAIAKFWC